MKQLMCAFALGTLALLPAVGLAAPGGKPTKVVIAHLAEVIEEFDEVTDELLSTTYKYVVLELPEQALNGHGNHEDLLDGEAFPDGTTFTAADHSRGQKIYIVIETEAEPVEPEEPVVE